MDHKYTAEVGAKSIGAAPVPFNTLRECRAHAESYGTTADWCVVRSAKTGRQKAAYRRCQSGNGLRWYKVA